MAALTWSPIGPGELTNLLDWLEPPTTIDRRKPGGDQDSAKVSTWEDALGEAMQKKLAT